MIRLALRLTSSAAAAFFARGSILIATGPTPLGRLGACLLAAAIFAALFVFRS